MLRLLTATDIPRLLEIETATQMSPWREEVFQNCFSSSCDCWGVESDNNNLVGFIIVSFTVLTEGHILNFAVDPAFQQRGYARALLETVLQHAREHQILRLWLEVRRSNTRAIKLYQNAGFVQMGERKNYYAELNGREDALVFLIEL